MTDLREKNFRRRWCSIWVPYWLPQPREIGAFALSMKITLAQSSSLLLGSLTVAPSTRLAPTFFIDGIASTVSKGT